MKKVANFVKIAMSHSWIRKKRRFRVSSDSILGLGIIVRIALIVVIMILNREIYISPKLILSGFNMQK